MHMSGQSVCCTAMQSYKVGAADGILKFCTWYAILAPPRAMDCGPLTSLYCPLHQCWMELKSISAGVDSRLCLVLHAKGIGWMNAAGKRLTCWAWVNMAG
eukprot:1160749-Pelagomonas_calceolata.AAC.10